MSRPRSLPFWVGFFLTASCVPAWSADPAYQVQPLTDAQAEEYKLAPSFYKKCTEVQEILIATSEKVSDFAHLETAYLFDQIMRSIDAEVAGRIPGDSGLESNSLKVPLLPKVIRSSASAEVG